MTLARRTTKAFGWQLLARACERGLKFVSTLILARILVPEDFGRVSAALVLVVVVETMSALGIDKAIVQSRRGDDPRFLAEALRFTVMRGFGVALVIAALAPVAAWYNEDSQILTMTLVVAISPAIVGFTNPWIASRRRALDFRAFAIASVCGGAAQVAVSFACAKAGMGALSVMIGIVASSAAMVLVGWFLARGTLDFTRDPEASAEIKGFVRKAMGTTFLGMLCTEAPSLVLGRMAGLATLGTYQLSRRLCSLPTEVALPMFGIVLGPAYASLRDEPARLRQVWLLALGGIPLVAVPAVVGAIVLDERLPAFIYGASYQSAPGLVSLLGVIGFIASLTSCCGPLFWGLGKPQFDRTQVGINFVFIAVTAVPATHFGGARGLAAALAVGQLVAFVYAIWHACRLAGAGAADVMRALAPSALLGGVSMAVIWSVDRGLGAIGAPEYLRVVGAGVEVAAAIGAAGLLLIRAQRQGARA